MKKILFGIVISCLFITCSNEKTEEETTSGDSTMSTDDKKTSDELLSMSEADDVKNSLMAFSKGDVEGMTANYDENIRYQWSGGDSLVGKKAVQDYYKGRWALIDSINFSEHIVLPVKVNVEQSQYAPLGKWVLSWHLANVKYKNGKSLVFWVHTVNHYNDAGKVDFVGQYIDRHPIMEATKDLMK